jgi:hypothetical protein
MATALDSSPLRTYIVLARDRRQQWTVTLYQLRQWASQNRITADQLIYSDETGQWATAGELQALRDVISLPRKSILGADLSRTNAVLIAVIALPVFFVIAALGTVLLGSRRESGASTTTQHAQPATPSKAQQFVDDAARHATRRLVAPATDDTVLADCQAVTPASLPQFARDRCRDALAAQASNGVSVQVARRALADAIAFGLPQKSVPAINHQIDLAIAREADAARELAREQEATQTFLEASTREAYGQMLRNRFLDQGMDIKVKVTGAHKDQITLRWALFGDVWTHRMEKADGLIPEIAALGFKRVDVTDGYNYHRYWTMSR